MVAFEVPEGVDQRKAEENMAGNKALFRIGTC